MDLSFFHRLTFFSSFRDLDAEGVKVTAYVTAHLNVDGDVYAEAAAVSEIKKAAVFFLRPKVILFSLSGRQLAEV